MNKQKLVMRFHATDHGDGNGRNENKQDSQDSKQFRYFPGPSHPEILPDGMFSWKIMAFCFFISTFSNILLYTQGLTCFG
jgi:hypothetical protein